MSDSRTKFEEGQEKNLKPQILGGYFNMEEAHKADIEHMKKSVEKMETPKHYDNSKGSLYKFAEDQKLNSWEYEVVKRIVRCRKKGEWISDIEKTIDVLRIYKEEQGHLYVGQTEKKNR